MALPAVDPRILAAAKSPLIWELGVNDAMDRFKLSNAQVHEARNLHLRSVGSKSVLAATYRRATFRLRRKVVRAEVKYPGITQDLLNSSLGQCGARHNLSRARCQVLLSNFKELAIHSKEPETRLFQEILNEARDKCSTGPEAEDDDGT